MYHKRLLCLEIELAPDKVFFGTESGYYEANSVQF